MSRKTRVDPAEVRRMERLAEAETDILEHEQEKARARRFFWVWFWFSVVVMVVGNALIPWMGDIDPRIVRTVTGVIPPVLAALSVVALKILADVGITSTVATWVVRGLWVGAFTLTVEAMVGAYGYGASGITPDAHEWTRFVFPVTVDLPVVAAVASLSALKPIPAREVRHLTRTLAARMEETDPLTVTATVDRVDTNTATATAVRPGGERRALTAPTTANTTADKVNTATTPTTANTKRTDPLTVTATTDKVDTATANTDTDQTTTVTVTATTDKVDTNTDQTNTATVDIDTTDTARELARALVDAKRTTLDAETTARVVSLLDAGVGPTDIAKRLDIPRGRVTRIRNMISDGGDGADDADTAPALHAV